MVEILRHRFALPEAPDDVHVEVQRPLALTPEMPQVPDLELPAKDFVFDGAMVLDDDPLSIGVNNYADLQNLRYTNLGLEGVQGYTKINNVTALPDPAIRSGIQFIKRINATPTSHVLVQSYAVGLVTSRVYLNLTDIPDQGDFESTALHTDGTGHGLGRFALAPDGNVVYCNGVETMIWGSDEHRVAAVINFDDAGGTTFSYDFTERLSNTQTDTANIATLVRRDSTNEVYLYIGSTRPLKGIKFYVDNANTGASTSTVEYWASGGWAAVTGFSDGTASGGVSLAQTGTMSFDSTISVALPKIIEDRYLYFYRVIVGATGTPDATIDISHITVDAPFQQAVDIWDGIERNPIQFHIDNQSDSNFYDFTLEVQEPSFVSSPIAAELSLVGASDYWIVGFEERMAAIRYKMAGNYLNEQATTIGVEYWDGSTWQSVADLVDGTTTPGSGQALSQSGLVSWTPAAKTAEFQAEFFGVKGYFYRFSLASGTFSSDPGVRADVVTGIPAPRYDKDDPAPGYAFPLAYRERVLLCGKPNSNEGNRIDYPATGAPDAHNGQDSSALGQAIFVGDSQDLTAGIELFNRFGDIITVQAVLTKKSQTWILVGSTPEDFQTFRISETVGCPCPLTMDRADISFSVDSAAVRNVALWVSYKGPMMFDGGVLTPMRFLQKDGQVSSIDPYFDPNDSRYINLTGLINARGWYDPQFSEYNLLLPTGGSTACNVWLVCDMQRRKWFRKVPLNFPQSAFHVIDADGAQYVYSGIDSGYMMRLENGNSWDSSNITHSLRTADMLLGGMWGETILRYIRATAKKESGDDDSISITHAVNGSESFSVIATLDLLSTGSDRYRRVTRSVNSKAWSHQFEMSVASDDKATAPRLINWGLRYEVDRAHGYDSIDNNIGQGETGPSATS